jgi:hypothetical protein
LLTVLYKPLLFQYPVGFLGSGDETTAKQLLGTIVTTRTIQRPLPGFENSGADRISMEMDFDEVYPNIYIGDV